MVLQLNLQKELHRHILDEDAVHDAVEHEEAPPIGSDEGDFEWRHDGRHEQSEDNETVPAPHVVRAGGVQEPLLVPQLVADDTHLLVAREIVPIPPGLVRLAKLDEVHVFRFIGPRLQEPHQPGTPHELLARSFCIL